MKKIALITALVATTTFATTTFADENIHHVDQPQPQKVEIQQQAKQILERAFTAFKTAYEALKNKCKNDQSN